FLFLTILLGGITMFLTSCSKDEDTSGSVLFWYGESTSDFLINDDAQTLTYYVDDEIVGSSATSVFWTGAPDCGQNGSITVTKNLGGDASKVYSYSVIDQTGFEYYSGTVAFTDGDCIAYELD
ncbi:MAG: hypothetical protein ACPG4Z_06185, partial [Chitinophagales bacterium]